MDIIPYGDHAILIKFENKIDITVNQKVIALFNIIKNTKPIGYRYCIPAYCSLTVVFDPLKTNFQKLKTKISNIQIKKDPTKFEVARTLSIPVCYDNKYAPDLKTFAKSKSLSTEEIISIHSENIYHVYMLGFLPGFAYLGKCDKSIKANRLSSPRLKVPAGSVGLAGLQTAIYPCESPGGWQLIGRTPIRIFDEAAENPFLFQEGDKVRFRQISEEEYKGLEVDIILDNFDSEIIIDVGN